MSTNGKICSECRIELRPDENGVYAVAMASFGPSEVYQADQWKCPSCGWKGLLGFGRIPIAEHFSHDILKLLDDLRRDGGTIVEFWMNKGEKEKFELIPA